MSDTLKILGAVGVGIYSIVGLHFYSILVSRTKSDVLRAFLYLTCIVFIFVGGFIGCAAITGGLYDTGQKPSPHDLHMRFFTVLSWIGTVWIYIIIKRRTLKQRLKINK